MSEIELKPCLYCKEERISIDVEVIEAPTEYNAFARCCNCDAQGPGAYRHDTKEAAMTEAAGLWNARPLENAAKPYTYIGKDGKAVLARDLEDHLTELKEAVLDVLSDMKARMDVGHGMCDGRKDDGVYVYPFGNGSYTRLMSALGDPDIEPSQGLADNDTKDKRIEELEEAIRVASECEVSKAFPLDADAFGPPGWKWTHPDGREWGGITDGKDYPPIHPLLRQVILKGDT